MSASHPAWRPVGTLVPGLVLAAALAVAATGLSRLVGEVLLGFPTSPISAGMLAIVLGIAASNLLRLPRWLSPGLGFAVKRVLRLGIVLLGARLSIAEVLRLGLLGLPIVAGCVAGGLVVTALIARWLRLPERLGTLIGVGTSICGVSAIVAAGPAIEAREEEVSYAVSVITVFGILATLAYPFLARLLFAGDPQKVGLFLGTSIHDTSQVAGAGLAYAESFAAPEALSTATVAKLVRNLFIAAVIPLAALRHRERNHGQPSGRGSFFPLFILGFLVLAALRSVGDLTLASTGGALWLLDEAAWKTAHGAASSWAARLLVVALAGVGSSTHLASLKGMGLKPFLAGLGAALCVGLISFLLIGLMGRLVLI